MSLEDLCTSRSPESPNMFSPGLLITSQLNPSQLLVLVYPKTFYWEGRLLLRVTQDVSGQHKAFETQVSSIGQHAKGCSPKQNCR